VNILYSQECSAEGVPDESKQSGERINFAATAVLTYLLSLFMNENVMMFRTSAKTILFL